MTRAHILVMTLLIGSCTYANADLFRHASSTKAAPQAQSDGIELPDPAVEAMKKSRPAPVRRSASVTQPPHIQLENVEAEIGEFVEIEPVTNCPEVKFYIMDGPGLSRVNGKWINPELSKTAMLAFAVREGVYRVACWGSLNDVPTDLAIATITITGHGPQPPPGPGPEPPTPPVPPQPPVPPAPPVPQSASLTIISIDNGRGRTAATSAFINATGYWASLNAAGHNYFLMDSNSVQAVPYKAQTDSVGGVPALIVMEGAKDASGKAKVLGVVPYPKDATGRPNPSTDWMTSVIAKFGGKAPGK